MSGPADLDENPYRSPESVCARSLYGISDEQVRELLVGPDSVQLMVADVSDCQLYGRRKYRRLSGEFEALAVQIGCKPEVYQAIWWWCLVFVPVWPKQSYLVAPLDQQDHHDEAYLVLPTDWSASQIVWHYVASFACVVAAISVLSWLF